MQKGKYAPSNAWWKMITMKRTLYCSGLETDNVSPMMIEWKTTGYEGRQLDTRTVMSNRSRLDVELLSNGLTSKLEDRDGEKLSRGRVGLRCISECGAFLRTPHRTLLLVAAALEDGLIWLRVLVPDVDRRSRSIDHAQFRESSGTDPE
jgi:hypothetical protein